MELLESIHKKKYISLSIGIIFLISYIILPYRFLTICSGSMKKTLNIGDIIFYKKIDTSYNLKE